MATLGSFAAPAAGCPVLLKPASATPLCGAALAEAVDEAELPPGVFQLVLGLTLMVLPLIFSSIYCPTL